MKMAFFAGTCQFVGAVFEKGDGGKGIAGVMDVLLRTKSLEREEKRGNECLDETTTWHEVNETLKGGGGETDEGTERPTPTPLACSVLVTAK